MRQIWKKDQKFAIVDGNLVMQTKQSAKKNTTIEAWTEAFLIFASIYLARNPVDIQGILKYMQIVRLGASRNPSGWIEYDKQFRLKMSKNTLLPWGSVDSELWLMYMSSHPTQSVHPLNQAQGKCYDYNFRGSCTKTACIYQHT